MVPIELTQEAGERIMHVNVTGTLIKSDYEHFVPEFERFEAEHGKVPVLLDMTDFRGWEAGALWDEIKFDAKHLSDFERVAVVGDKKWEEVMTALCKPLKGSEIRYFDENQLEEAQTWLKN